MRSVKRTLEDQKELYRAPFKPSNFKWDALVLGGTAALLATDRHIEKHIGHAHYNFYQASFDVAIGGLGATLGAVYLWGIKRRSSARQGNGSAGIRNAGEHIPDLHTDAVTGGTGTSGQGKREWRFLEAPQHQHFLSWWTFAMATVVSHEYPQKWVQALAYSAATIVTVSRFMAWDHWSSDMLVGSALGIGIGSHIFHAHCNPDLSDSCKHHVRWIF